MSTWSLVGRVGRSSGPEGRYERNIITSSVYSWLTHSRPSPAFVDPGGRGKKARKSQLKPACRACRPGDCSSRSKAGTPGKRGSPQLRMRS